jgi:hypothetical protein
LAMMDNASIPVQPASAASSSAAGRNAPLGSLRVQRHAHAVPGVRVEAHPTAPAHERPFLHDPSLGGSAARPSGRSAGSSGPNGAIDHTRDRASRTYAGTASASSSGSGSAVSNCSW